MHSYDSAWLDNQPINIVFLVPPEVHILDLYGPAHVFYETSEMGANIQIHFCSMDSANDASSSAGLTFAKLKPYGSLRLQEKDLIFLPGLQEKIYLDARFIASIEPMFNWLRSQYASGVSIASVCTGSFLLAASKIANGRSITTHWRYVDLLKKKFPEVKVGRDQLFTEDSGIYSSAGVSSGIDLALYIVEKNFGALLASSVAREMVVYFRRSAGDPQLNVFLQFRNHMENRLHEVQSLIAEDLSVTHSISELAHKVQMSERNLSRLFKKVTGITIGTYRSRLRCEKALNLLKKGVNLQATAAECGFKSTNQLRSIVKKYFEKLPSELRLD